MLEIHKRICVHFFQIFIRVLKYSKNCQTTCLKIQQMLTGPSGLKFITRNELYNIIEDTNETTFDKKLQFME